MKESEKLTRDLEASEDDMVEMTEEGDFNFLSVDNIFRIGLQHRQIGRVKCWVYGVRCVDS